MKKYIFIRPVILACALCTAFTATLTSCNDEWEDEQYEQYISFRAPLNDQGVTPIYVPYTRKNAEGTPLYGQGESSYQLPIIVSGSTSNNRSLDVHVAHDPDTLPLVHAERDVGEDVLVPVVDRYVLEVKHGRAASKPHPSQR